MWCRRIFIFASSGYMAECEGVTPIKDIYSHISGIDLVQGKDRNWYVLEDNRNYAKLLRRTMDNVNAGGHTVILTPGRYNAAYFEHSYLAEKTGAHLVNGSELRVKDDKGIYYFVPKMIRYYLGEEPILNNAPTYLPFYEEDMKYVLEHFDKLVLKDVAEPEIDYYKIVYEVESIL